MHCRHLLIFRLQTLFIIESEFYMYPLWKPCNLNRRCVSADADTKGYSTLVLPCLQSDRSFCLFFTNIYITSLIENYWNFLQAKVIGPHPLNQLVCMRWVHVSSHAMPICACVHCRCTWYVLIATEDEWDIDWTLWTVFWWSDSQMQKCHWCPNEFKHVYTHSHSHGK